jgi:hypothetical protein
MTRAVVELNSPFDRRKAAHWANTAPVGSRVEFKAPRRSSDQNALMWVCLTKVAGALEWHGQRYTAEDWKDFFMHALKRARWMPTEEGGMVPIGMRTSDLGKEEMGDLITVIQEFAARHEIDLSEGSKDDDGANNPASVAA